MLYFSANMWKSLSLAFLAVPLLFAQSPAPNITGVWKADLQKSKIAGPPPSNYLEIIQEKTVVIDRKTQEKAQELDELTGVWSPRGEQRSPLAFVPNGKAYLRAYEGVPTRITASWEGNTLKLTGEVAGRPQVIKRTYELSPDGQTLTIDTLITGIPHEQHNTIVLLKQPDSAGDPLRQPEETAEKHFKNVKTEAFKNLPESEFLEQMRYIAWALNKDCEFCHVRNHFDSDDKKEKKTARDMIEMTASIDHDNFKGRPNVRCFTCHEGHSHPLNHPLFPDEAAALQAAEAQKPGPDRPMQGAGSGPQGPKPADVPPSKPPQQ